MLNFRCEVQPVCTALRTVKTELIAHVKYSYQNVLLSIQRGFKLVLLENIRVTV